MKTRPLLVETLERREVHAGGLMQLVAYGAQDVYLSANVNQGQAYQEVAVAQSKSVQQIAAQPSASFVASIRAITAETRHAIQELARVGQMLALAQAKTQQQVVQIAVDARGNKEQRIQQILNLAETRAASIRHQTDQIVANLGSDEIGLYVSSLTRK